MERASEALVKMDYLTCESLCLQALAMAHQQSAWSYYARILLPLQEARRQRRMIAAEGLLRFGTEGLTPPIVHWLAACDTGCIVVTAPHTADDARALDAAARQQRRHVEVLYAAPSPEMGTWTIRSFQGPEVHCTVSAPHDSWQHRWLDPHTPEPGNGAGAVATPADWFLNAGECLGDAALAQVRMDLPAHDRLVQLEQMLQVVIDHELLHQRLGDAARAIP